MINFLFSIDADQFDYAKDLVPINKDYVFKSSNIAFGPISKINIFIGENNSGKSRFLRHLYRTSFYGFSNDGYKNFYNSIRSELRTTNPYYKIKFGIKDFNYIYDIVASKKTIYANVPNEFFYELSKVAQEVSADDKFYVPVLRGVKDYRSIINNKLKDFAGSARSIQNKDPINHYISLLNLEPSGLEKFDIYREIIVREYFKDSHNVTTDNILTGGKLYQEIKKGNTILCEGAQATMLDVDHGTYPYVTSSNATIGGILTGTGLSHKNINDVYGILKAYASRVGEGPFVTEEKGEIGEVIRKLGHEYGATTNRPRRCGWLDLVALKYACQINGINKLAINHLDTIGKLDNFKLCIAYNYLDQKITPQNEQFNIRNYGNYEPIYECFEGNFSLEKAKDWNSLPKSIKEYINCIEDLTETPITLIGTGPKRENIIEIEKPKVKILKPYETSY